MSTVTMQELELEHAELLPRRETLLTFTKVVHVTNITSIANANHNNNDNGNVVGSGNHGGGFVSPVIAGNGSDDGNTQLNLALNL